MIIKTSKWQVITLSLIGIVLALSSFHIDASAAPLSGTQKVMVLRVYFDDYADSSRYTQAEVKGFSMSSTNSGVIPPTTTSISVIK